MGEISEEDIVEHLKKLDLTKYQDFSKLGPLENALWCLLVVKDNTMVKKLTAKAISFILTNIKEIHIDEKSIIRALSRAGNKIKADKINSKIFYEIMSPGKEYLINLPINNNPKIHFVNGANAWSSTNKNLPILIKKLDQEIMIVDPYYGLGTLYTLEKISENKKIRFLTSKLGSDENDDKFKKEFLKFKNEFRNIQIKKYDKFYELHDRYILSSNGLIIIGHGLKDLGSKESFIIALFDDEIKSFISNLIQSFENKWNKSVIL